MTIENVIKYIEENKARYVKEMVEFCKIKSVSADKAFNKDTRKCAEWTVEYLKKIGGKNVRLIETDLHPVVYGEMIADKSKPTFLVYGHYDVQPAVKSDGWNTDPFEPVIKDNFIYGRGVADDKGKMLVSLSAIEAFAATKTPLNVNLKFFIEGEEEAGGVHTAQVVQNNKELLACDGVVLFDSPWILPDFPSICYSLKGLCYWQVDIKGPNRDLHSGVYGGKIRNPLNAAAQMVAKLHDADGRVTIPGFYDDVVPLKDEERKEFAAIPFKDSDVLNDVGVDSLPGEKGYSALERNWGRPVLDANGIWGGYQGEGIKTVIPSEAHFKVSARLVANQDAKKIDAAFKKYIYEICPTGVKITKVTTLQCANPVMTPIDNRFLKSMASAIETSFGKKPALVRMGASVPICAEFKDSLGAPSLLFDLNVPDENIHGPNEKLDLNAFHNGIKAAACFYDLAGK